ncbi:3-phenylpropionate/cinnamic acid dioxygenase subunit beta [Neopusillimonas aestuarii]|uniref:3-phenylpropionate/cinnamic acid dioxygenase subunit beta n=1 Tax=Neopusillimonas aestuarii TaxID=2716226 RepID=UPI001982488D|nr:3-phenylpropionate/cinnamic acid dioxygenase subunit beta [Pusillimonas sp. DMV24BSW_D]
MSVDVACFAKGVAMEMHFEISKFLYKEARLLDTEKWDEWLQLMAPDVHYWMPMPENRRRTDSMGAYERGQGALFDDNFFDLQRRVARFKQPSAWAEDPPTRHVHLISGIEAYGGDTAEEYLVHSTFVNYRSRLDRDNDVLVGRRQDVLRKNANSFLIAKRKILTTQAVLLSKNFNTFL